jgi:shikimate kinase
MVRLKKTVVMVGMMGAGKTAVGTAVARLLKVPFVDSDEEIVKAANRSIAEIFERDGEPFFRDREFEVIGRLLRGAPCVLSTGGGAFLSDRNRSQINESGVSVWLRADLDLLWHRVRHKTTRPLLRTENPRDTLRQLNEARLQFYTKADLAVDASADYSVEQMAGRVIEALKTRPDVLEEA